MDAELPLLAASEASFPWLSLIVLLPAVGAMLMPLLPGDESKPSPLPRNHRRQLARLRAICVQIDLILFLGGLAK